MEIEVWTRFPEYGWDGGVWTDIETKVLHHESEKIDKLDAGAQTCPNQSAAEREV